MRSPLVSHRSRVLLASLGALFGAAALLWPAAAGAFTGGSAPSLVVTETVLGDASVHADSLMTNNGTVNQFLKVGGGTANITGVPANAQVVRAFVFWAGSTDPMFGTDRTIDLTLPDGTFLNDLSVDFPRPGEPASALNRCVTLTVQGPIGPVPFFSCRREITFLLQQLDPTDIGGLYVGDDVNALEGGTVDGFGNCTTNPNCQAMFGAFAVAIIWQSPSSTVSRTIQVYDSFFGVDETYNPLFSSGISPPFTLSGFTVGDTADARLTVFSFEGDAQLGNPPQNLVPPDDQLFCPSCPDFIELTGSVPAVRMFGPGNPAGNLFNATIQGQPPTPGVDLDTFNIGAGGFGVLEPGDTSFQLVVGSGDGMFGNGNPGAPSPNQGGAGELVILGPMLLTLDTLAPRLNGPDTQKTVLEGASSPGGVLHYILRVDNDGSAQATNVRVLDQLPAGVTYVPGSTTNTCGVTSTDVGGTSPALIAPGLNVGTLAVGEECEVRFQVTVNGNVADGTVLQNFFTVSADSLPGVQIGPATTIIQTPDIGQPTKTVTVLGGGDAVPGAPLIYTIRVPNDGDQVANGVSVDDTLPADIEFVSMISTPPGSTNNSAAGVIDVSNITIAANSFAEVVFAAQIRAGTAPGTVITNQASVDAPSLMAPVLTDDPGLPGAQDPTSLTVVSSVNLATSTKAVVDLNGGLLIPGDVLEYTITATQSGSQALTVTVSDDLPSFVTACTVTQVPAGGFAVCNPGGANGTGRVDGTVPVLAGSSAILRFRVTVVAAAPDGFLVGNQAVLTPLQDPAQLVTVTSPTLEVFARPVFTTSTKAVQDLNGGDVRPGDVLRYTINVTNSGPVGAANATVTDVVNPNLQVVTIGQGGTQAGSTLTWILGNLGAGNSTSVTFDAQVLAGTANGTTIANSATVSADAPANPFTTPAVSVQVVATPLLTFEKTVADLNAAPFEPADFVRYQLTLRNDGDGAANNVEIRDPIDPSFSQVVLGGGGQQVGNEVVFNTVSVPALASLSPGDQVVLLFDAQIATPLANGTVISNQAFATADEVLTPLGSDVNVGNATPAEPTVFQVTSQAVLALTKTFVDVNGGALLPGERVQFTLTVENTGNAPATGVTLADPLDARLTFVDATGGGVLVGNQVQYASPATPGLANLLPGTPVSVTFRADVAFPLPNGTLIPNQASAASPVAATVASDDPTTPAPLDPTVLLVESRPVLDNLAKTVTELDGDGVFRPGDRIRYEITFSNTGSENAFNLVLTDVVPAGLENVVPGNGGTLAGGTITWNGATTPGFAGIAPNQARTVAFEADIVRPLADFFVVSNQATLVADGVTPVLSDDPATGAVDDPTVFEVRSLPELVVQKRVTDLNGGAVEPGDVLQYELRVRNEGDRAATDLVVDDPLPAELVGAVPQDGGAVVGSSVVWNGAGNAALVSLAIDTEVTLRFTATVVSPLANGTFVDNQASVATGEPGIPGAPWLSDDPTTAAPLDPTRVQVVSAANLAASTLESFDEGGAVTDTTRPGDLLTYVLVLRNNGNAVGTDVVATVPLPPTLAPETAIGGSIVGNTVTFSAAGVPELAALAPGDEVTVTIEARVAFPLDDGVLIDVQATLDADDLVNPFVTDDPSTPAVGDLTRVVVISSSDLSGTEKTFVDINGAPAEPGDLIQYRITVLNSGDANATGVTVVDPLPAQVTFVSSSSGAIVVGGTVQLTPATTPTLAAVAPNTPLDLFFTVRINDGVADNTPVDNQATVQPQGGPATLTDDPATAAVDDPTRFFVETVPELTVTKAISSPGGRVLAPGDPVNYTITVLSSGTATVGASTLTDALPSALVNVAVTPPGVYNPGPHTVTANLGPLAPSQQVVLTLTATVADDATNGTPVNNQAQVVAPEVGTVLSDDPDTPVVGDVTAAVVEAFPDLSLSTKAAIDVNGGSLLPGDELRYVITVVNSGNGQAREVQVTDVIDTNSLEIIEVLNGGQAAGSTVVWAQDGNPALQEIPGLGGQVELVVRVRVRTTVDDGAVIDNQALVNARDLPAPVPTDDPATAAVDDVTRVTVQAPVLTFTKAFTDQNGGALNPGDAVSWTLTVTNNGSGSATGLAIADLLPLRLTGAQVSGGGTIANGLATWNVPNLGPQGSVSFQISGVVDPLALGGETLANQAEMDVNEIADPILSDDPTTVPVGDATVRTIEGAEGYGGTVELFDAESGAPLVTAVVPGQRVAVRVTMQHTGSQAGQSVVVRIPFLPTQFVLDESPDGIQNPEGTAMRWTASNRPELAVVFPGTELVFEASGIIQSPIPDGIVIPVEARVTSAVSPGQEFVLGPAEMTVRSKPDLNASTKEVIDENGGVVEPGDLLTYRLTLINAGGAEARDVRVVDPAPPGTVYVPGSIEVAGVPIVDGNDNPLAGDGLAVGDVSASRSLVVQFRVRVDVSAVRGLEIANQAVLRALDAPDTVTDNPATPLVLGDKTSVVVGGGPLLVVQKRSSSPSVAVAGTVVFEIAIENGGSDLARDLVLLDDLVAPGRYVAGSASIDGVPVTDAADGDPFVFTDTPSPRIEVRRDLLEAGEGMLVTFSAVAEAGPALTNQASVTAAGLAPVLSDSDPAVPGPQPTVVPVSGGLVSILVDQEATSLVDGNGGLLRPEDPIVLSTVLRNRSLGAVDVQGAAFELSSLFVFDPATLEGTDFEWDGAGRVIRMRAGVDLRLEPDEAHTFRFTGTVDPDAAVGEQVRGTAEAVLALANGGPTLDADLGSGALTVGLMQGAGAVAGTVFFEGEDRNGTFDPTVDGRAIGFSVLAFREGREDEPVRTATTDDRGRYELTPLPAGTYRLEVRSPGGTTFRTLSLGALGDGEVQDRDIRIDPSGVVYRSGTFQPLRGVRVFLYVDDGDDDLGNDVLVPEEQLLPGQQGQVTPRQGLYRFDPPPGDYRLGIEVTDPLLSWPSSAIEPNRAGGATHPLGAVARPAPDGRIVAHAVPDAALDSTYFLRFQLAEDLPPVLNNHVPLDSIRDALRITKTANRKRLSIGDLVLYTVRVENPSGGDVRLSDGGVEIVDTLPVGFRLVPDSYRVDRIETDARGQQRRSIVPAVQGGGGRNLTFGAFALRANSAYELRYSVVVGPGTPLGVAENRALLQTAQGQVPLTDTVVARVRVVPDPIFDLGTLRAKVFCDEDGDGWQDAGDLPVGGARVYIDTGHYAESDASGKVHFTGIPPGTHLAKLDERTLPPGIALREDARKNFYISAGLPAQLSFPASCRFDMLNRPEVHLNLSAWEVPEPPVPTRPVKIAGELPTQRIVLDGVTMEAATADLGIALEGQELAFGRADGPNVTGLKDGVLRERLVFVPRATGERPVAAWQITVQREHPAGSRPLGPPPAAPGFGTGEAAPADPEGAGPDDAGVGGAADRALDGADGGVPSDLSDGGALAAADAPVEPAVAPAPADAWTVEPVYVFAGEGALPPRLVWDGKDAQGGEQLLEEGARYSAVLSIVVEGGDEGFSGARPFGVAWGEPSVPAAGAGEGFETSVDAVEGPLFGADDAPTPRTRAWLESLADRLKASPGKVELRVHVDARPDEATAALTARQAQAAATVLAEVGLPADRVEAIGEGDTKPVRPNLRDRDRKANQRVEVRLVEQQATWPAVEAHRWPAEVLINGEAQPLPEGDVFAYEKELPIGSKLVVDVRGPGLGRFRVTRLVEEGPFDAAPGQRTGEEEATLLDGDLAARRLLWGTREAPLDLLQVRLLPVVPHKDGGALLALPGGRADLALQTELGTVREWAGWSLRIMREVQTGEGAPPARDEQTEAEEGGADVFSPSTGGLRRRVGGPSEVTRSEFQAARDGEGAAGSATAEAAEATEDDGAVDGGAQPEPIQPPLRKRAEPERRFQVLRELKGVGTPPAEIHWDGTGAGGVFLPSEGDVYYVRLIAEAVGGDVGISPDLRVAVGNDADRAVQAQELAVLKDPATSRGQLTRAARRELARLAKTLPPSGTLRVEAHENRGSRLTHRTQSQAIAEAVKKELVKAGVPEERVLALGLGSDKPLVPAVNNRARTQNRRVTVAVETPAEQAGAGPDQLDRVMANGRPLVVDGAGFRGEVPASRSGEVAVFLRTAQGARAVHRLRPETVAMWQGTPRAVEQHLAAEVEARKAAEQEALLKRLFGPAADADAAAATTGAPASEVEETSNPSSGGTAGADGGSAEVAAEGGADGGVAPGVDGGVEPTVAPARLAAERDGAAAGGGADGGTPEPAVARGEAEGDAEVDGGAVVAAAASEGPFYVQGRVPYRGQGAPPSWWPSLSDVPAARLQVFLPPDGEKVTTDDFVVRGVTDPTNRVLVGGTEVKVDPQTGEFQHLLHLTKGVTEIVIEAIDTMGNRGRIRRLVQVDTDGWFFLLLGEAAFGMDGARLDERSPTTSLSLPFDTFVYGRGVAYVKGELQSPYVFKDIDLTLHVDTRRWAQEAFVRDVFEPDVLYPVYADSSVEVQDAQASYPLYLRLKADASSAIVGNVRTELTGGDLFRYHRTRYGAMVTFDRGWSQGLGLEVDPQKPVIAPQHDPWRTQARVFATGGTDSSRHARVELWGTGGSIYFLRHEDVVEGSERVFFIVRDGVTGTEIARAAKLRNQDYTIRYPEGRIVFKEPVPAFADQAFLLNHNLGQVRGGHRVYVEIEYDHQSDEPFQGFAAGGQVQQTIWGHAEVGAGYVYEGRADGAPAYQLAGFHTKLFLDAGTYVKGELAWSQSVDAGNFLSLDGGLSYSSLGQSLDEEPVRYGRVVFPTQRMGWAAKLEAQAMLGEYVGRQDKDAVVRAYFQRQSPGFFAGASIVEQGQWKGGAEGRWQITDYDLLQLRADYVWSEIAEIPHVTEARNLHRALATLKYQRKLPWQVTANAEYGAGFTYDTATFGSSNTANPFYYLTNIGALGVDWQLLQSLKIGIKQEVILTGDGTFLGAEFLGLQGEGRQLQTWNDHFVTHLFAQYALTESLALNLTESVRWNGENQTTFGLSWKVNETSRVYTNERLGMTRQGFTSTTVIGGETQPVSGTRTYGEYQLTSGFSGQQSRGVAGIVNRVKLPFGLGINFGYERTQVLGGNVAPTNTNAVPPGAFTDGTFFAAPGQNGGGDYLYGAGSRDAASLGIEYKRESVLFSQRLELRYDNFDEDRGGHDRVWGLSMTNFQWAITPEISLMARYNIAISWDLLYNTREAHFEEGTFGFAYRPITHDWISIWAKAQRRVEVRPISLKEGRLDEYTVHAGTFEPIVELPWKFQFVMKGAVKHAMQVVDDLQPAHAFTFLGIGRLNWHALGTIRSFGINPYIPGDIDLGVEYRALWGITSATIEHGFLIEAQYAPLPYFRMGVGWNFTRFTDNVLDRNDQDQSGFFIRAVGQY